MLPSLQYTDFHKFLVSVGGVISGVGVGIPVLLLRNQSTLKIPQKEFLQLNAEAREAIRAQQIQVAFMLHYWPYVSAALLMVGLSFIVWGAVLWRRQQSRTDTREVAELAKIEAEREKTYQETLVLLRDHQAPPRIEEQLQEENEVTESATEDDAPLPVDSVEAPRRASDPDVAPPAQRGNRPAFPSLYTLTQKATQDVIYAFVSTYGNELDIVPEIRIGATRVDAAVTSRNPGMSNLLLDVKVVRPQRTSVRNRVDDAIAWALRVRRAAKMELKQPFLPVVFFVVDVNGSPDQQALFQTGQLESSSLVVGRVREALDDLTGMELPLLIAVGALDDITPGVLKTIAWKAQTPRVVDLAAISVREEMAPS
ncbi:hypothetical protein [Micromonospora sp. CA-244673]|uniref:hypothetical protein n=1 Tax=Micromonospora sp. CA-244673 TaxID=3239958 RepID=UPI003D927F36